MLSFRMLVGMILAVSAIPSMSFAGPQKVVAVNLNSLPSNADIYVNGLRQNVLTGPGTAINMKPGVYDIRFDLAGYEPFVTQIKVDQDPIHIRFPMKPLPGELRLVMSDNTQADATLEVDGDVVGEIPNAPLRLMPQKEHLIVIKKAGCKTFTQNVTLNSQDSKIVQVQLSCGNKPEPIQEKKGVLFVAITDAFGKPIPGISLLVDGSQQGVGQDIEQASPGDHLLVASAPGYLSERRTVSVEPGKRIVVTFVLKEDQEVQKENQKIQKVQADAEALALANRPATLAVAVISEMRVPIHNPTILLDGKAQPLETIPPGEHTLAVNLLGYQTVTQTVVLQPGESRSLQIQLSPIERKKEGFLKFALTPAIPDIQFFVNGTSYNVAQATSGTGIRLDVPLEGATFATEVKKAGWGNIKNKITLQAGETKKVEMDSSILLISSDPQGAKVAIDGTSVGFAPLQQVVSVGPHRVEIGKEGYQSFVTQAEGKPNANVSLQAKLVPQKMVQSFVEAQQEASILSATPLLPKHIAADIGIGYPYLIRSSLNVGLWRKKQYGVDVGAGVRTTIYDTNIGVQVRAQYLQFGHFSMGARTYMGGGAGPAGRNSFLFETGPLLTFAYGRVLFTVHPYLQVYSDRHCPSVERLQDTYLNDSATYANWVAGEGRIGARCAGAPDNNMPMGYPNAVLDGVNGAYDPRNPLYQNAGTGVLERNVGARLMIRATLEVPILTWLNLWFLFEASPTGQRQGFTQKFSGFFPNADMPLYGAAGVTFKY